MRYSLIVFLFPWFVFAAPLEGECACDQSGIWLQCLQSGDWHAETNCSNGETFYLNFPDLIPGEACDIRRYGYINDSLVSYLEGTETVPAYPDALTYLTAAMLYAPPPPQAPSFDLINTFSGSPSGSTNHNVNLSGVQAGDALLIAVASDGAVSFTMPGWQILSQHTAATGGVSSFIAIAMSDGAQSAQYTTSALESTSYAVYQFRGIDLFSNPPVLVGPLDGNDTEPVTPAITLGAFNFSFIAVDTYLSAIGSGPPGFAVETYGSGAAAQLGYALVNTQGVYNWALQSANDWVGYTVSIGD